jgi:hypothetical protein
MVWFPNYTLLQEVSLRRMLVTLDILSSGRMILVPGVGR